MDLSSSSLSSISFKTDSFSSSFSSGFSRKSSQKSLRNIKLPPIKEPSRSLNILLTEVDVGSEPETKNDLNLRDSYAVSLMGRYMKSSEYRQFQQFVNDFSKSERYFDLSILKKIAETFDKIVSCYQFSYNLTTVHLKDSSFHIFPIESQDSVAKVMGILLPEMVRFPVSLYRKLEVRVFQFCSAISKLKNTDPVKANKKLYNWLFITKEPINPKAIRRHFYKTVWFNLKQLIPNFDDLWVKTFPRKSDGMALELFYGHMRDYVLEQDQQNWPDILEDQFETFCTLMENPRKNFGDDQTLLKKVKLIKRALEGYDHYLG